ncbi:MAG TPA: FAD-dependent thymidylate synthase [Candidatus Paceibacterota bacterium]|nr:FAD-dependent thymidylate synthase [Candidatus Paceibacterota bacterium]
MAPRIHIYDEFGPEDTAMMQALYSRSAKSVTEHVEKVRETGSGSFMEKFYVGYGHASIADCGSTTIFIEGVSMLVAKAVQDWPLYSGQETSSRYINMAAQPIKDPVQTPESKAILERWMNFYISSQEAVKDHVRDTFPKKPDENEVVYEKAVVARSFDILRGFLPAGVTTQLSWHTNLRQAHDKLSSLVYHPLKEVRDVAEEILKQLRAKYGHSFAHKVYEEQEEYRKTVAETLTYYTGKRVPSGFAAMTTIRNADLKPFKKILKNRPAKAVLPHILTELGELSFECLIDFGSFRDLQRHRNGVCRMPRLGTSFGFEKWYLEALPVDVREEAEALIKLQRQSINALPANADEKQYYCAMGFLVSAKMTYGLPAATYVMELRSGKTVHATLRAVAHKMYRFMSRRFPEVTLHPDLSLDDWDVRRGLHDIKER